MRPKMLAATGPHQGKLAVRATDVHLPYHDTPFIQVFQLDFFLPGVQVLKRFGECNFRKLSGEYIFQAAIVCVLQGRIQLRPFLQDVRTVPNRSQRGYRGWGIIRLGCSHDVVLCWGQLPDCR